MMPISLQIEIPEKLYGAFQIFLDRCPEWDQDRSLTAALSLFLMQNSVDPEAQKVYLNTMFEEGARS